jgi:hypothetical protein
LKWGTQQTRSKQHAPAMKFLLMFIFAYFYCQFSSVLFALSFHIERGISFNLILKLNYWYSFAGAQHVAIGPPSSPRHHCYLVLVVNLPTPPCIVISSGQEPRSRGLTGIMLCHSYWILHTTLREPLKKDQNQTRKQTSREPIIQQEEKGGHVMLGDDATRLMMWRVEVVERVLLLLLLLPSCDRPHRLALARSTHDTHLHLHALIVPFIVDRRIR